jgi:serine/threonine-protein kinase
VRGEDGPLEVVEPEEWYDFVTILDFGAARFLRYVPNAYDDVGSMIGTPAYMAPETAQNGEADARSDVYSLGIICYEMLTGSVPFEAARPVDVMLKHVHEAPEPPRLRNPNVEITAEAERAIMRALDKDPARRHASMSEFAADLQRCCGCMRFRRPAAALASGIALQALRDPSRLPAESASVRELSRVPPGESTPPPVALPPAGPDPARPSGPILLTRRKPDR